ncbi:hypothetical protein BP6252_10249 [Coleophoma cylindrospora]|uniref:Heterokaryon incompatibility domain-containing protein n=1 Tax=Coleophoma cylindrospora TaxID=1849047 RepID=A0A3D8QSE6_9HELO|nr:hypothetical protein BP6252_10249 [Coleophoma cylindrospora]
MDHLPVPKDACIVNNLNIPFLASGAYDGLEFQTYPERYGWPVVRSHSGTFIMHNGTTCEVRDAGGMLQTWLFFGLIHAVTGELPNPDSCRIARKDGKDHFTTAALNDLVGTWSVKFMEQEWSIYESELQIWKDKVYKCLIFARATILSLKMNAYYADLDLVFMAIAALGEYLNQAVKDIFLKRGLEAPVQQHWRERNFADCGSPLIKIMRQRGWCPNQLAALDAPAVMPIGRLWFLANMIPPKASLNHGSCSVNICQHMSVSTSDYRIKHQSEYCSCPLTGPVQQDIAYSLEIGTIPVVTIRSTTPEESGANIYVEAEPFTPDTEFVAVSHVWSDGHGNPKSNTLPNCFLHTLANMVDVLPRADTASNPKLWLDTLCVPHGGSTNPLRKVALRRLKDPYLKARHVLVLDSYLQYLDSANMSAVDVVSRIDICSWSQRLWTFQEGRLGARVWFQFRDGPVELFNIIENGWRESFFRIPSLSSHSVDLSILGSYNSSKIWVDTELHNSSVQLYYMRHSLCSRATSKAEDEAICLASIMSLPMDPILSTEGSSARMQKFWSSFTKLPVGLAFSMASQKLDAEGYRWAPSSLMGDHEVVRWGGPQGTFEKITAEPSDQGLMVQVYSRSITPISGPIDMPERKLQNAKRLLLSLFNKEIDAPESFVLRDEIGSWYKCILGQNWHQNPAELDLSKKPAILLTRPGKQYEYNYPKQSSESLWFEEGILVTYSTPSGHNKPLVARAHRHVMLAKLGVLDSQLCSETWSLAESIWNEMPPEHAVFDTVDLKADALIRQNVALIKLGRQANKAHGVEYSDEAVIRDVKASIRLLFSLLPWCGIETLSEYKTWCVS